jgi:HD superfamily phosphohydrolase
MLENGTASKPHVFNDPIHGVMQYNNKQKSRIKPIIDSPEFQRLRHIKQLGLADYVFPGAVHTRFNHSIGASYVATQIAEQVNMADDDAELAMTAALLHDIGHGPFSHAFEQASKTQNTETIKHEEWTKHFLEALRDKVQGIDINQLVAIIRHHDEDYNPPRCRYRVSSQRSSGYIRQ